MGDIAREINKIIQVIIMIRKKQAIIIMSRIPIPGRTKTRLMSNLSGIECAAFHQSCLYDICNLIKSSGNAAYLFYDGEDFEGFYYNLLSLALRPSLRESFNDIKIHKQRGQDLGEKLFNAGSEILEEYDKVIFLGADLPDLTLKDIDEAFDKLIYHDIVIGPAYDGGYYLLGIKQPIEGIFQNITWGTSKVLEETLDSIREMDLSVSMMQPKRDIDTWEDLRDFYQRLKRDNSRKNLISFQYAEYLFTNF